MLTAAGRKRLRGVAIQKRQLKYYYFCILDIG